MANDFIKLTNMNQKQSQIDALSKIGEYKTGINGGKVVWNGTDLSVFQGDINNFKNSRLGGFDKDQLGLIFNALDVNGDGNLAMDELQSFAALGNDEDNIIDDDKNIIDELDFKALYEMAQDYVDKGLEDDITDVDTKPTTTTTTTDTTNTTNTTNKTDSTTVTEKTEEKAQTPKTQATIGNNEAYALATELYEAMDGWGTDEDTVNGILLERGYNSADIVKIMDAYEKQYNVSLMEDIQGDFSGSEETPLREALYNAAGQQALESLGWQSVEDIPEDIVIKANEFYSQMNSADATGYMKNFDKLSASEKAQILLACDVLHSDELSVSRVTEGRVWFGKEDGYVRNMIDSFREVAASDTSEVSTNTTAATEEKVQTPKTQATIGNNEAYALATELFEAMDGWGTNEAKVNGILLERGYNSADIVKIMDAYEKQYNVSLMEDIQGDFSGSEETPLREALYNAAGQQALESLGWQSVEDIPEDIVIKANEFYSQMNSADATGYMKNFDKLSASEKAQILLACDILHAGTSSVSRVTEGRVWFGKEDGYVRNMIDSFRQVAKG